MIKQFRQPKAKKGELLVKYGTLNGDKDIYYCYNGDASMKRDTRFLSSFFESYKSMYGLTFIEELKQRGYDITTLKVSIKKLDAGEKDDDIK